jgi:GTP-binding protein
MSTKIPVVSIAGRQNVGKSTLFNALLKEKIAIVDDFPGLTRDILSYRVTIGGKSFMLCDTPGLDLPKESALSERILENAHDHLSKSSLVILLLENPDIAPFDLGLIRLLRKMSVPTIVAVNKMDSVESMENMSNFYETGLSDILPISAKFKVNLHLLTDKIAQNLPDFKEKESASDIKIAIVGRPNSGKSTLLNSFMGFERSIVSEVPGTTRDSVRDHFNFNGKRIEIIDTAGLRKRSKMKKDNVEFFSLTRSVDSIRKADIVMHLIDAEKGLCDNDKKIADEIIKSRKPMVIALNKWDLIEKDEKTFNKMKEELTYQFYRAKDFPIISISAMEKQRIHKLLSTAIELKEKSARRIETSKLNKALEEIAKTGRLPGFDTKYKVYYGTQIDTVPPQFKLFVKNADNFRPDVIRFFEKEFSRMMDLEGIPIIIHIEGKDKTKNPFAFKAKAAGKKPVRPKKKEGFKKR